MLDLSVGISSGAWVATNQIGSVLRGIVADRHTLDGRRRPLQGARWPGQGQ